MQKKLPFILALLGVLLLIGSFPARASAVSGLCDGMRIAGFLTLIAVTVLRLQ